MERDLFLTLRSSTALLHGPTVVTSLLNGGVSGTKNYLCCKQCAVVPIGEYNAEHLLSPQARHLLSLLSVTVNFFNGEEGRKGWTA